MSNHLQQLKNIFLESEVFNGLFRYNLMTHDIEFTRKADIDYWFHSSTLNDDDLIHIKDYVSYTKGKEYDKRRIEEALLLVSKRKAYHPLLNYLENLVWDKNERLDYWLKWGCGVDLNQYTMDVARKILCGAVARIYNPGCKFDYMMILEGDQGIGKSTLVEVLGGDWYINTHLAGPEKKDMVDILRTAWIVEIADLAGFSKMDIQNLKSFIDRKVDRVRLPYDKRSKDFPRQCILIGTHNPSGENQYFKDDTGNRRYWTIECRKIDIGRMKEIRDQLFAEAVVRYKAGETLYIDNNESLKILNEMHKKREVYNPWNKSIDEFLSLKSSVTMNEVIAGAFQCNINTMNYRDLRSKQTAIGIWFKKHNWVKKDDEYFNPEYIGGGL